MGQALALQFIRAQGFEVLYVLDQRSARTRALARDAGIAAVGYLAQLLQACDMILSIIDPGQALTFAHELANAIQSARRKPLVVDCNAIAPATMHPVRDVIEGAGSPCTDAAVMGPPPTASVKSRLFVSGLLAPLLVPLATPQLSVQVVSERIVDASAVKMFDAVMPKRVTAMLLQMVAAARRLGVADALDAQCEGPRRYLHDWIVRTLPIMPPKAYRWGPEVDEIAKTLESAGLSGNLMRACAGIYESVARTALGQETPEQGDPANRQGD